MDKLNKSWDGEKVLERFDEETGTWMVIAIHSTVLGIATGGTRMKTYHDRDAALDDAMRLAEGMTYKWAGVEFPRGGGKCVLSIPFDLDEDQRESLLSNYGLWLAELGGIFETGPDLGTTPVDMALIKQQYQGVFGCPPEAGGMGDPGPYTALGVFEGIKASCQQRFQSEHLVGCSVLVQGVGGVGKPLMRMLIDAGFVVKFSDVDIDRVERIREEFGLTYVEPGDVYSERCDVFTPCAVGGVLSSKTIPQLKCALVAGAANNQLETSQDGEALHQRGILYAPDYIINAGGAIFLISTESMGWSVGQARARVQKIGRTLTDLYAHAEHQGISTSLAADQIAKQRVKEASVK